MAEFVYDALGRRIYACDNIAQTARYFCYNNAWQVLEEYNTAGQFAWANVFGNYIDEVLVRSVTSSQYYYAHNHLYSPVAVMDFTAGTVLERYDYDAYGTTHIMDASYAARTASAVGNPYSFTGRELDTLDGGNLKTMHYRTRSYNSIMGRFTENDPFGFINSLNLYEYVISNPLFHVDPYGYNAVAIGVGELVGVGAIGCLLIPSCRDGVRDALRAAGEGLIRIGDRARDGMIKIGDGIIGRKRIDVIPRIKVKCDAIPIVNPNIQTCFYIRVNPWQNKCVYYCPETDSYIEMYSPPNCPETIPVDKDGYNPVGH